MSRCRVLLGCGWEEQEGGGVSLRGGGVGYSSTNTALFFQRGAGAYIGRGWRRSRQSALAPPAPHNKSTAMASKVCAVCLFILVTSLWPRLWKTPTWGLNQRSELSYYRIELSDKQFLQCYCVSVQPNVWQISCCMLTSNVANLPHHLVIFALQVVRFCASNVRSKRWIRTCIQL